MSKEMKYTDLIPVIVERTKATLPEGFDSWGIKSILPDLTTRNGYQWPFPGGIAECDPKKIDADSASACPRHEGDGLCVATSWRGMASGGFPARTLLLVAYGADEVLGRDDTEGKLRCPRVAVVALADGERLLREAGSGADLRGADLRRANLRGANLRWASLSEANLSEANLSGANLSGAENASLPAGWKVNEVGLAVKE